jgi:hypothetical protein
MEDFFYWAMKIALLRCSVCFGWLYLGSDSAASPYLRPHAFPPDGCTYHSLVQLCRRAIQCGFARCASDSRPRLGADGVELASVAATGGVYRPPYLRARPALTRRGTHSLPSFLRSLLKTRRTSVLARAESLRSAMGHSEVKVGRARFKLVSFSSSSALLFDGIVDVSVLSPVNEPTAPGARWVSCSRSYLSLLTGDGVVVGGGLRDICPLDLVPRV